MRITLNLATRPFTDLGPALKRLRIAMAVLAALCILFGIGLHVLDRKAEAARIREHALDREIARIRAERQADEDLMRMPANAQVLEQAQALNELFDEKAFSWTLAMEAMETVLPAGVQVTSIEPLRAKDGSITVHLRVLGPHDRSEDLVRNLERSKRFLQPRIVGETAESSTGPSRQQEPVSASNRFEFDLFADYNPPSPEERLAAERMAAKAARAAGAGPRPEQGAGPGATPSGARTPHGFQYPSATQQNGRQPYTGPAPPKPPGTNPPYFRNPTPGGPH
jgi:type IV pilus assembly protein PilN